MITREAANIIGCPESSILSTVERGGGYRDSLRRCLVHSVDRKGHTRLTVLIRHGERGRWTIQSSISPMTFEEVPQYASAS